MGGRLHYKIREPSGGCVALDVCCHSDTGSGLQGTVCHYRCGVVQLGKEVVQSLSAYKTGWEQEKVGSRLACEAEKVQVVFALCNTYSSGAMYK